MRVRSLSEVAPGSSCPPFPSSRSTPAPEESRRRHRWWRCRQPRKSRRQLLSKAASISSPVPKLVARRIKLLSADAGHSRGQATSTTAVEPSPVMPQAPQQAAHRAGDTFKMRLPPVALIIHPVVPSPPSARAAGPPSFQDRPPQRPGDGCRHCRRSREPAKELGAMTIFSG